MQWGQIKTLFILCFLLLDIYLLYLVIEKQENDELEYTSDPQERENVEDLELENIKIPDDLPDALSDEEFLITKQRTFNNEEVEQIESLENQEIEVVNNSFILSYLEKAVAIPENASNSDIEKLVASTVYYGNEFLFEYWDKGKNILVFFQKKNDRPVYFNQNGMILIYLNDKNEMIAYSQSFLGDSEIGGEERPVIKPINAIMKLFDNNLLNSNDEITDMEIGYFTTIPLDSGRQVLGPTWKIIINDSKERFVNGIDQYVIPPVNDKFVDDVLELSIEYTRSIHDNEEFKNNMLEILTNKLMNNRSESS